MTSTVQDRQIELTPKSASPRLFVATDFVSAQEIAEVLAFTRCPQTLDAHGIQTRQDQTGFSCELPIQELTVLRTISERLEKTLGMTNDCGATLRFRRYGVGEFHPPHFDVYRIGESNLILTAIIYLSDTEAGGETHFPLAQPSPLKISPRRGQLLVWFNHQPSGVVDTASYHEGLPVMAGEKVTLTAFYYKPLRYAAHQLPNIVSPLANNLTSR